MKWLLYLLYIPAFIAVVMSRYPLAPIAVALQKNHKLRWPFRWLDTIDNDLGGDDGWVENHITGDRYSYWNMVRWVWRNGGNYAAYNWFGCAEGEDYPLHRQIHFGWLELFLGWNMPGAKHGRCKIVLTVRIKRA